MNENTCWNCEQKGAINECRVCHHMFCDDCYDDHEFYEHSEKIENLKKIKEEDKVKVEFT